MDNIKDSTFTNYSVSGINDVPSNETLNEIKAFREDFNDFKNQVIDFIESNKKKLDEVKTGEIKEESTDIPEVEEVKAPEVSLDIEEPKIEINTEPELPSLDVNEEPEKENNNEGEFMSMEDLLSASNDTQVLEGVNDVPSLTEETNNQVIDSVVPEVPTPVASVETPIAEVPVAPVAPTVEPTVEGIAPVAPVETPVAEVPVAPVVPNVEPTVEGIAPVAPVETPVAEVPVAPVMPTVEPTVEGIAPVAPVENTNPNVEVLNINISENVQTQDNQQRNTIVTSDEQTNLINFKSKNEQINNQSAQVMTLKSAA